MRKTGKQVLAFLLTIIMILGTTAAVFADEPAADPAEAAVEEAAEAEPAEEAAEEPAPLMQAAEQFAYDGDSFAFIKADGSNFGMFAPQEGSSAVLFNGEVYFNFIPKSKTIYKGFYFGDITDESTRNGYIEAQSDGENPYGVYKFALSEGTCGYAWPIVPIKAKDGGTTSDQYYLAIPAKDKLAKAAEKFAYDGSDVNFIKADGSQFGMWTPQDGSKIEYAGDKITITVYPKSATVYSKMNFGDINYPETWSNPIDIPGTEEGGKTYYRPITITVDASYAGYAWPVVPIKAKDGATTSDQYYLAIPKKQVTRVYGGDRFATALSIADELKEVKGVEKFDAVVLATAGKFPDALAGGFLAYVKNAPILLISAGEENRAKVVDYINKNLADNGTIYALGSTEVVADEWIEPLKSGERKVTRLAGNDRFGTNLAILKEVGVPAGEDILVATGANYADALSASGVPMPILLVSAKGLTADQIAYLNEMKGSKFHILGGANVVSEDIEAALKEYGDVDRTAGDNRYLTSTAIAEQFCAKTNGMAMAYGMNFPDGLCGGPLALAAGCPLILTNNTEKAIEATTAYAKAKGLATGYVFGSGKLITDETVKKLCDGAEIVEYHPYGE